MQTSCSSVSGLLQETGARSLARCIASISLCARARDIYKPSAGRRDIQTWMYMDWQNTAPAALAHLFVVYVSICQCARYTTALHSEPEIYYIYWLRTRPILSQKDSRRANNSPDRDKFG
jgi:hypothetical protein